MTDAEKRGNVIRGLECCLKFFNQEGCPEECPYISDGRCYETIKRDALALLKEQEPRVLTLEELEDWDGAIFFEAFETDMYYALIENVELTAGMDGEYVLVNVVPGEHHRRIWSGEHYGSIWRCWTSRPTPEQMRETKWEEMP